MKGHVQRDIGDMVLEELVERELKVAPDNTNNGGPGRTPKRIDLIVEEFNVCGAGAGETPTEARLHHDEKLPAHAPTIAVIPTRPRLMRAHAPPPCEHKLGQSVVVAQCALAAVLLADVKQHDEVPHGRRLRMMLGASKNINKQPMQTEKR